VPSDERAGPGETEPGTVPDAIDESVTPSPGAAAAEAARRRMPVTKLAPAGPAVSRIGLGLAALGRPAYITSGRAGDLPDRSVAGLAARTTGMLDAAYARGITYFDAARSYGRAEEFLGAWLASRDHPDAVAGSKWGYRYTGDWRMDAPEHEVKEHSLAMFTAQLAQTRALLGDRLALYEVHSLTARSGLLDDQPLLAAIAALRASGVLTGVTTSGPGQAAALRRALDATVDGEPVFCVAQVTWNLLEPSVGAAAAEAAAAGWTILVKEALANGRLAPGGDGADALAEATGLAGVPALAGLTAATGDPAMSADAVAIAAALANPWAGVVLSGAVTPGQLTANLRALDLVELAGLELSGLGLPKLAEPSEDYWAARAARAWQ
jgi:aryl-alcohol dehydrogenase-like predicted oxidoreductase